MDEKHINANRSEPDQDKSDGDVPVGLSSFGSDRAVYNGESVGNTSNNSDGILMQNENGKNQDVVNVMLNNFQDMNLDENLEFVPEDLIRQINEYKKQVKERKVWAQETALNAARRLCNDLSDLKMLRMEREETQQLKASGQFDPTNEAVRRFETENAELRAEIEASELSASETVTTFSEVSKEKKKLEKKLKTWENQKAKMEKEIEEEKKKISEIQQQMLVMEAAKKDAETKWREEQKAKERAAEQVEEERRLKEAAEASTKSRQEALHLKIEQEISRFKASVEMTQQSANLDDSSEKEAGNNIKCMNCRHGKVSVLFFPCAHQVLCVNCNEECEKKGESTCPSCYGPIRERICIIGATSS